MQGRNTVPIHCHSVQELPYRPGGSVAVTKVVRYHPCTSVAIGFGWAKSVAADIGCMQHVKDYSMLSVL